MRQVVRRMLLIAALSGGAATAGVIAAGPASAVVPSPPPGAPAVESAPSSLVGANPQLPPGVIAASAAKGSRWKPEKAIYGTASINDIKIKGAGGTTIRVNEIYPTTASGAARQGAVPGPVDDDALRKGPGRLEQPGSAASPSSGAATGGADNYLAQRGYIEVVEDVRGTGDSNGSWGLFDPIQQQDAIKVLHWAAHLPHSDGRVGTYGPSYLGIDQMLLAGAVGQALAAQGDLPDGQRQRHLPGHVVHGRAPGLRVQRDLPRAHGRTNTTNPSATPPATRRCSPIWPRIEADHANGLRQLSRRRRPTNILTGGDEAYDGSYWQARNPQNVIRADRRQPHPGVPDRGRVRHLPERRADQLRRAAERLGRPQRHRADAPGPAHDRALSADRRPLGAPQRLLGRRRPARARVVRHLAQARAAPAWPGRRRRCTTTTSARVSSTRPRRIRSPAATPTRLYFGAGGTLTSAAPVERQRARRRAPHIAARPRRSRQGPRPLRRRAGADDERSARLEPVRRRRAGARSTSGRWAASPSRGLGRPARAVRRRRPAHPGRAVGRSATRRLRSPSRDRRRADHRHRLRELDNPETELVAELEDVTPDGASYPLTEGALLGSLRARRREPLLDGQRGDRAALSPLHAARPPRPVTPGAVTEYQIQIFPTLATIAKGNRLRLTALDDRHAAPDAAAQAASAARRRGLHDPALGRAARPRSPSTCCISRGGSARIGERFSPECAVWVAARKKAAAPLRSPAVTPRDRVRA